MAIGNLTVTAKIGAGGSATATSLPNVQKLFFHFDYNTLEVFSSPQGQTAQAGLNPGVTSGVGNLFKQFDINAISTITMTLASGVYTITIS